MVSSEEMRLLHRQYDIAALPPFVSGTFAVTGTHSDGSSGVLNYDLTFSADGLRLAWCAASGRLGVLDGVPLRDRLAHAP